MSRIVNPFANSNTGYPTDPAWAAIGNNIATALFGDPEARAVAHQRRAEMERVKAATGYDLERTRGAVIQNDARESIDGGLANFFKPQSAPEPQVPQMPGLPEVSVSGVGTTPQPSAGIASAFLDPLRGLGGAPVRGGQYGAPRDYGAHGGADFTAPMGTKVFPRTGGGRAIVSRSPKGGNIVTLDYGNGITSKSMHLGDVFVQNGQIVSADTPIGTVGMTGRTTGPHLHEEVTIGGKRVDPTTLSGRQMPNTVSMPTTAASSPVGSVSQPTLAPEPGGPEIDMEKFSEYVAALARSGEGGHADSLVGVMLAAAGGDSNARKALLARGKSPGSDFAASREAQFNNMALDQYGSLAKTMSEETLAQAGSTQREGISQAGQNARNTADNALDWRKAQLEDATDRRGQDMRETTSKRYLISSKEVDEEIDRQMGIDPKALRKWREKWNNDRESGATLEPYLGRLDLPFDLKAKVRARAGEIASGTRNIPAAVMQAVRELGVQYQPAGSQRADGSTRDSPAYTFRQAPAASARVLRFDSQGNQVP